MTIGEINFCGFPKESVMFYLELRSNNNKAWFDTHKADFERFVMEPARTFVSAMGARLQHFSPAIHADPRYNQSIFRIYRDIRFSKNKSPYKTHLGILFWEGSLPKKECSGYYFHLEPPVMMLAAGMHTFSKAGLKAYREAVADSQYGPALVDAIRTVQELGPYGLNGQHYQRVPRGFDPNSERADLLRHNGLSVSFETPIPEIFYTSDLLDYCTRHYREMAPVHRWLVSLTEIMAIEN